MVVTLAEPSISFIYNLAYVWIVNKDATDLTTAEDGTGPYVLDGWTRGSSLSLKRWDDYWGTPAANGEVVFNYFTDATALSNALLTNAVDIITNVQSPDALAEFENNPDYVVNNGTSTTKEILVFNDRVAPFDKVEVRKAIYSAIDRAKLLNAIWGDKGTLIGSMVPPTDPWYVDLVAENPYDPELSKQLLADAGYPDGFEFTLDTPTYDPHPVVAEFVKSELAKIGVTVNINSITADEWYTKVFQKLDYVATLQEHVNDRDVVWYGNPDFYWGYDNPQVTQWVAEAEQAKTVEEQTAKLKLVNEQIAKDAASAWLYLYPQLVVASADRQRLPHQRAQLACSPPIPSSSNSDRSGPSARERRGPRDPFTGTPAPGKAAGPARHGSVPPPPHRHPRRLVAGRDGRDLPPPAGACPATRPTRCCRSTRRPSRSPRRGPRSVRTCRSSSSSSDWFRRHDHPRPGELLRQHPAGRSGDRLPAWR